MPLVMELIFYSLLSDDIRILIFSLLRDYLKGKKSNSKKIINDINKKSDYINNAKKQKLKKTLKEENINDEEINQPFSLFNSNVIKTLLSIITPAEVDIIKSELKKFKSSFKKINKTINKFVSNEQEKQKENKQNQEVQESLANKDIKTYYSDDNWVNLSSSWFKKGIFKKSNENSLTGELTGLFQSDKSKNKTWYGPYTFPSFPVETWELMKLQVGKNGSGAGSIFWHYWNHTWLPSKIREYVKERLKKSQGIVKGQKTKPPLFQSELIKLVPSQNINVQKTLQYIHRLERNFPKLKKFENLSEKEIGSKLWVQKRQSNSFFAYAKASNQFAYKKNTTKKR